MILSDNDLIYISQHSLKNKISEKLNITFDSFHTIMLIGSCVFPETMSDRSDLDIVLFLHDDVITHPGSFKAGVQTNTSGSTNGDNQLQVDAKIYTLSSFKNEMYHGSLTRVFAILNAFRIISAKNDYIINILSDAKERFDIYINLTIDQLAKIAIPNEISNLENYFRDARAKLDSGKIRTNYMLINLKLFEYLKEFIIQYQYILFAIDIQKNENQDKIREAIKNLLVFKNTDGTRLLDHTKYFVDKRIISFLSGINTILDEKRAIDYKTKINLIFNLMNAEFVKYTGSSLINNKSEYQYFSTIKIDATI